MQDTIVSMDLYRKDSRLYTASHWLHSSWSGKPV